MLHYSYIPLTEPYLKLCTHMGVVYSCKNAHLLEHRSAHTCASVINTQVDSLMNALHCKEKYIINLKPDPTPLDPGDLILLSNLPRPKALVCAVENQSIPLDYSTYSITHRPDFCKYSF